MSIRINKRTGASFGWRFATFVVVLGLLRFPGVMAAGDDASNANPEESRLAVAIMQHVVQSRNAIRSIQARVTSDYHSTMTANVVSRLWSRLIYYQHGKIRGDLQVPCSNADSEGMECVTVSCFGCYDGTKHVFYSTASPMEGREYGLSITDEHLLPRTNHYVPDIRWIGTVPVPVMELEGSSPEKELILQPATGFPPGVKVTALMEEADYQGRRCRIVRYGYGTNTRYAFWICEDLGGSIVRAEMVSEMKGGPPSRVSYSVESELRQYPEAGLWFPSQVRYLRTHDEQPVVTELVNIDVVSINEELPQEVFSLKGIEVLEPGVSVIWVSHDQPPARGQLMWDGDKIVSRSQSPPQQTQTSTSRPSTLPKVLLVFALIGGASGAGLLLISRKRGSQMTRECPTMPR